MPEQWKYLTLGDTFVDDYFDRSSSDITHGALICTACYDKIRAIIKLTIKQ